MPLVSDLHEIRQVVIVRIAVIKEAAFFDQQAPGVDRTGRSCMPADGPAAGRGLYRRDGARDTIPFLGLIEIGMTFPSPPVRRDLMAAARRILRQKRQAFDGSPARTPGGRGTT